MKATVEKQANCQATLHIEVPAERLQAAREGVLNLFAKTASVPGFRPGKAPRATVAKRYESDIKSRAMQNLEQEVLRASIDEQGLKVISVDDAKLDLADDGSAKLSYTLTLQPEVNLPNYKGLKIEVQKLDITEEFIDKILVRQAENFATHKEVTDRAAAMGDFCEIAYEATVAGAPMKDLLPESEAFLANNVGFLFKLEEKNFLPGFAAQLVGAKAGDTLAVTVTIPAEANAAIAGQEAVYKVSVSTVKEQELPAIDDAFAARLLPDKNLEELRAFIRERVEADSNTAQLNQKRTNVLSALTGQSEFDVPKAMVDRAAQRRINELVNSNLRQGITQDMIKEGEAQLVDAATNQAGVDVKQEFLLLEIAKAEGLQVTEQDYLMQIVQIAQQNNVAPAKVRKQIEKNGQANNLATGILLEKTVQFLIDAAEIEYRTVTPEEAEASAEAQ